MKYDREQKHGVVILMANILSMHNEVEISLVDYDITITALRC